MISNGMFYLSTSPHCNRLSVSNTPLQPLRLERVCSQFSCTQNSFINTPRLFSMMKIKTCLPLSCWKKKTTENIA